METIFFLQIVGAVIVGNVLFSLWAYFVWRIVQNEKNGLAPFKLTFGEYACGIVPPVYIVIAISLLAK